MLLCRECGGRVIVDPSKIPIISDKDLWYHCMCEECKQPLGMLANVESPDRYYDPDQTRRYLSAPKYRPN